MTEVIIVHRWGGMPNDDWYPWLKKELEAKGFEVIIPEMPDTENPRIDAWVNHLKNNSKMDEDTILIGHSIGCQAVLRVLETKGSKVKGVVLIAPWIELSGLETDEEKKIAKEWVEKNINFSKVKERAKKIICIFSDNDPYVPASNTKLFKDNLNARCIIEKAQGHFNGEKYPIILKEVLSC